MKTMKKAVSTPAKLDNALSKEALDRIAMEDIIPTEAQISRILPVLRESRTAKWCKKGCRRLEHRGQCVVIKRS